MKSNQQKYIEYAERFAGNNKIHIWLGGSCLHGGATEFSDVDISVCCDGETLCKYIYGYGQPVYISYTSNPLGILIVIYEDGTALDLEIIEKIDIINCEYFRRSDIKEINYVRNESICREFVLCDDIMYQMSRLFHRSLIKFLSGKRDSGAGIANEIVAFMNAQNFVDESNYKRGFPEILRIFRERYPLPAAYDNLLHELMGNLDSAE